jgi:hypothetical protein
LLGWISEHWGPRFGLALGGGFSLAAALFAASSIRARRRTGAMARGAGEAAEVIAAA